MKKYNDIQNLRDLSRKDLLELMIRQSEKIEDLQAKLYEANQKLVQSVLIMEKSGSIAEAALKLNDV